MGRRMLRLQTISAYSESDVEGEEEEEEEEEEEGFINSLAIMWRREGKKRKK